MGRSAAGLVLCVGSILLVSCGSDDDQSSGLNLNSGQPPAAGSSSPVTVEKTKEDLLEESIDGMIALLEKGDTPLFFEHYVDAYTLSQVKIHNATFPDRKSLQKLYDGFDEGIAKDLAADLKACKALTPEILEQDEGWFSAYFFDEDTMTSEVVLGYDPQYDDDWELLELPLTLPWGNTQRESQQWLEWESLVYKEDGASRGDRYQESFQYHQNPAAVIAACNIAFNGRVHDARLKMKMEEDPQLRQKSIREYMAQLTPDAQRIESAILVRRLLVHKNSNEHADSTYALLDRYGLDRTGLDNRFTFKNLEDIAFYRTFAERFPDQTDWAALVAEGSEQYRKIAGERYPLKYPFGTGRVQLQQDGEAVRFTVNWVPAHDYGNENVPTRFYEIDGKWYVESYWQAKANSPE